MTLLSFIIWSANPEIFPDISWIPVRWYGLLFAFAFIVGQQLYFYFYKQEGKPEKDVETLTIFMVIGTILGARLGHVFFYEPDRFLANPVEIFKIWKGGLASHGASVGILISVWVYCNYLISISFNEFTIKKRKREGQGFLYIMDRIVIVVALGGAFVRFGNFMNSEILGRPTNSEKGIVFARDVIDRLKYEKVIDQVSLTYPKGEGSDTLISPVDIHILFKKLPDSEDYLNAYVSIQLKQLLVRSEYVNMHIREPENTRLNYTLSKNKNGYYEAVIHTSAIPRHPAQLYESLSCIILFLILLTIWKRRWKTIVDGRIFGIFLIILFMLRFFYEFLKINQVAFEDKMSLNMGQWLSIPFILLGIYLILRKEPQPGKIPA
jgi:phosphatidylglycerol:prolipoprotein diacylglycerol transferase